MDLCGSQGVSKRLEQKHFEDFCVSSSDSYQYREKKDQNGMEAHCDQWCGKKNENLADQDI